MTLGFRRSALSCGATEPHEGRSDRSPPGRDIQHQDRPRSGSSVACGSMCGAADEQGRRTRRRQGGNVTFGPLGPSSVTGFHPQMPALRYVIAPSTPSRSRMPPITATCQPDPLTRRPRSRRQIQALRHDPCSRKEWAVAQEVPLCVAPALACYRSRSGDRRGQREGGRHGVYVGVDGCQSVRSVRDGSSVCRGRPDYSAFVSNIVRKLTGSIPPWRPTTPS